MTLTILQLEQMLKHRAGRPVSPELGIYTIANYVGEFLTTCHQWQWRNGPETFLDLVANQSWVSLPDDFGELRTGGIVAAASAPFSFIMTDDSVIGYFSQQFTEATKGPFLYGAITYTSTDDDGPERRPIVSIAPTWPENLTGALRCSYRTRWNVLQTGVKHVDIPRFMEPLYVELCHAYYAGHAEHDEGSVTMRLQAVLEQNDEDSLLYAAAKRSDGAVQGSFGRVTGGLVQLIRRSRVVDDDNPFPPLVTYP
jgi:hypothetical protein